MLRRLWMWSKERKAGEDKTGKCCAYCGKKKSKAKGRECRIDVHHINGINWTKILTAVREELLCDPTKLTPLCVECHLGEHGKKSAKAVKKSGIGTKTNKKRRKR